MSVISESLTTSHGPTAPLVRDHSPSPSSESLAVVPIRHWGRWIASALVAFLVAQFLWSLITNSRYEWGVFAEYFLSPAVLRGLVNTLLLTVISITGGFVLGTALATFRLSGSPLLATVAWWYIWLFRSVPVLVQVLVWYNLGYLYPTLGLGTPFTEDFWLVSFPTVQLFTGFAAVAVGLTLNQAAYSAEIIRAGIISVDQGQLEAAAALGLPRRKRFFRIILPQAARAILPNFFNSLVGQVKETSVGFIVALPELFYTVQVIYGRNQRIIPLLLVAVAWYAIVTTALTIAQFYIERRYARGSVRELPLTPPQRFRQAVAALWRQLGDSPPSTATEKGHDS